MFMNTTSKVTWKCPANIALIKYWGKKGPQIPANPSVSMTLKKSYTTTEIILEKGSGLEFYFEGSENKSFKEKILKYIKNLPYDKIKDYKFIISSKNTFPHSAGIASSASSMGALGLGLATLLETDDFKKLASDLARQGSGSACRSIYGGIVSWGKFSGETSDLYASQVMDIHDNFKGMRDSILIVDSGVKKISSRAGHNLMDDHPFKEERFKQALQNLNELLKSLKGGDWSSFGRIVELEALSLHALMMTSTSPYILMKPMTLKFIEKITEFRKASGLHLYFTLDAGPNIHVLYPKYQEKDVRSFLDNLDVETIHDEMGEGPERLHFEGETC